MSGMADHEVVADIFCAPKSPTAYSAMLIGPPRPLKSGRVPLWVWIVLEKDSAIEQEKVRINNNAAEIPFFMNNYLVSSYKYLIEARYFFAFYNIIWELLKKKTQVLPIS
ncbi:MAG: hypothetical protein ACFFBS_02545 [Promethearchaeota archaeon]